MEIDMNKQLSRRHFNTLCAVGLSLPVGGNFASVLAEDAPPRTVKLRNSVLVPAIGQALRDWAKGDIRKRLRKKRCAQAYRSG